MSNRSLVLLIAALSCGSSEAVNPDAPSLQSVSPAPQRIGAPRDSRIVIRFSDPINPSSVTSASVSVFGRWSGVIRGETELSEGNRVLTFIPDRAFLAGEWVSASLSGEVSTAGQGQVQSRYSWNFWAATRRTSLDLSEIGRREVRRPGEGLVQSYGAYAGDLDGDGFSDLMIPNEIANDVRVFMNDGSGDYGEFSIHPIPSGSVPSTNEGGDFNGDGITDLVVGNGGNNLVSLFIGLGGGSFQHSSNTVTGRSPTGACVLDLDGDGDPDVATANWRGATGSGDVSLLINDGSGNFSVSGSIETTARGGKTCAAADANGDGITDFFVGAVGSGDVVLFLGDGNGGLTLQQKISAGGNAWTIVPGDMNGDGHVDVVTSNRRQGTFSVILGDGNGNLQPATTYSTGDGALSVDVGDIDGDGDLDVVTSDFEGKSFSVHENLGGGEFSLRYTFEATGAGSCAIIYDRDGDGDLDVTGIDEIDDLIYLYENNG